MSTFRATSAERGTTLTGDAKLEFVSQLFDVVAHRYDAVNAVLALGFVDRWRRKALSAGLVATFAPAFARGRRVFRRGDSVLDVGCGTGNVTRFLEYEAMNYLALDVVGVDCSKNMIEEARRLTPGEAKYEVGNAGKLRFADASFDCVTTCYTLRNFSDVPETLREMFRVCKPNGTLLILDAFPPTGIFGAVLRLWLRFVLPLVGALMTGEKKAYAYLGTSIERARTPREVAHELEALGAEAVEISALFPFGAASAIIARKPFDGSSK
jgi:demethylmenaquinone methyltransferase/2-methoxy-6-polyprenyl-1,4-benzoquinol methylase